MALLALLVLAAVVSPAVAAPKSKCKCSYSKLTDPDYYDIPTYVDCLGNNTVSTANGKAYCAGGAVNSRDCCKACSTSTSFTCNYWVHIPSSPSETACKGGDCGKCIMLKTKDGITANKKGGGKKIRIGEPCPSGANDPHFFGAHGTRYDFNGLPDKSFCLFTDRRVHVNMAMRGYYDSRTVNAALIVDGKAVRTWIRQLAVMWHADNGASHSLVLTARDGKEQARGNGFLASAVVDGVELPRLGQAGESAVVDGMALTFVGAEKTGPYDVDAYNVKVDGLIELDLKLRVAHPLLQTPDDAQVHINVMFNEVAPTSDVHGVMGQTYRDGREQRAQDFSRLAAALHHPVSAETAEGKGFLDGTPSDYETSAVDAADCKFTVFNGAELPLQA